MNPDHRELYSRAPRSPWREILRNRWSGRMDQTLVLKTPDGTYLEPPSRRRRGQQPGPLPDTAYESEGAPRFPGLSGTYEAAYHVDLGERTSTQGVTLATAYGTEPVDVHVLWWVYNPVEVVRTRTRYGWDPVRGDLRRRLHELEEQCATAGQTPGAPEIMQHLSAPTELSHCGLAYYVTDVTAKEAEGVLRLGQAGAGAAPFSWTSGRPEDYHFCMQAVSKGPVSLAALWLMRHPDQVREVLDWTVHNAGLIRGDTSWQDDIATLLGHLSEEEQGELSKLLRDRLLSLGRPIPAQHTHQDPAYAKANGWPQGPANGWPR